MNKRITKRQRVWKFIKANGSITRRDSIYKCSYTNLPDLIYVWKHRGIHITSMTETKDGESWSRYFITPEEAERAEKEGLVV